jgi:hypothetical protein
MKQETKDPTTGTVASRECPLCGHHEIGFVTQDGEFYPLRPGTPIRVFEPPSPVQSLREIQQAPVSRETAEEGAHRLWVPDPLRGDKTLRLKYSVLVKGQLSQTRLSGGLYERAYVDKLDRLIDKVIEVPLPVILDQFFHAPHLASGNSRQVAEAMVRELDEVQRPVSLMRDWLERGDAQSLENLIAPKSVRDLGRDPADDAQVERELQALSLEEFLEML